MRWTTNDLQQVLDNKEYIDTIIVPLCPVSLHPESINLADQREDLTIITSELERNFKGRIVIAPEFTYLQNDPSKFERLFAWNNEFISNGMKHIFYITCDYEWKQEKNELDESIIWIPDLTINSLDEASQKVVVNKQVSHLSAFFLKKW